MGYSCSDGMCGALDCQRCHPGNGPDICQECGEIIRNEDGCENCAGKSICALKYECEFGDKCPHGTPHESSEECLSKCHINAAKCFPVEDAEGRQAYAKKWFHEYNDEDEDDNMIGKVKMSVQPPAQLGEGVNIDAIADRVDEIVPGKLGLVESDEKAEERGDLNKIGNLSRLIQTYANDLYKYADMQDVRRARLAAVELNGALDEILHNMDLLCKEHDLHKLKA